MDNGETSLYVGHVNQRERPAWLELTDIPDPGVRVRLRLSQTESGRIAIAEIRVTAETFVTTDLLRRLPVSRWEAWINSSSFRPIALETLEGGGTFGPDAFEALWEASDSRHRALLTLMLETTGRPAPKRRDLKLSIPNSRRKPTAFYERVAEVYSAAAAASNRPAALVAEANQIPAETVHQWVREARRRGLLAAGRKQREASE